MDDQITVRLPTLLGRTLRRTSRRLGRRPSHVVRMALEAFLQEAPSDGGKRADRVEHLIGSLSWGIPDLAERHRDYCSRVVEACAVSCCSIPVRWSRSSIAARRTT